MKTTVSVYDFRDAFIRIGRKEQFSYEALGLIYDWIEENDPDSELDVVAVCCEFDEQSPRDLAYSYGIDISSCSNDDDEILRTVREHMHEETIVIGETAAGNLIFIQY